MAHVGALDDFFVTVWECANAMVPRLRGIPNNGA